LCRLLNLLCIESYIRRQRKARYSSKEMLQYLSSISAAEISIGACQMSTFLQHAGPTEPLSEPVHLSEENKVHKRRRRREAPILRRYCQTYRNTDRASVWTRASNFHSKGFRFSAAILPTEKFPHRPRHMSILFALLIAMQCLCLCMPSTIKRVASQKAGLYNVYM
jgi:hypothetical protein